MDRAAAKRPARIFFITLGNAKACDRPEHEEDGRAQPDGRCACPPVSMDGPASCKTAVRACDRIA